ncbi:fumarylacetoacetate hydrolase family protein [Candidatus Halobonum tyrrellensis]|uniref:Fumarylacetoacetate (FAA) hydrolase n=1 Tax=Candidatus Halobonum tyrrellensis G22 TaxID=1324957 RepID=V4HEE5_9EURY|nr:fumarylacetoacetate hydrolase family protein [Candidatus Halobonum tyrrellensis]ESP89070.1 fumarylacetoacetate (FAA) hydrolase [Candidatus Halobonum tyrrellensis G22]
MRLARARTPDGHREGEFRDGTLVTDDAEYDVDESDLLAPCEPSAVYCIGRNFAATIEQMEYERPDEPDFFIKPPASVVGHRDSVSYPDWTDELTYAGELVAVIGERCRGVASEDVPGVVRGYTVMNDLDALDQPGRTARKAFDGSGPLGPWIETDVDPTDVDMHTEVAGERRQESNTGLMLFDPSEVVSFLSERVTFRPGDAVAFGSPANPGTVEPGETVDITYDGVGTLSNRVVAPDE